MLTIVTRGSCLFGGCMYSLDSLKGVMHMLVCPEWWDDENVLQTVFYHTKTIMCEHFNVLILLGYNFNNSVTLSKHKVKTAWRRCRCTETCNSAYGI